MDSWKNKQKVIVQLVCILLSLCLWIYVTNIKNPIKSYELKNVPVEILNSNSLQDSGLALVPNQNFYVNLKIEGNTQDLFNVDKDSFKIIVDLSEYVLKKGENKVAVNIKESPSSITIKNSNGLTISVNTEEYATNEVPVKSEINITSKSSYYVATPVFSPKTVVVSGPKSLVKKVTKVVAQGEESNASKTIVKDFIISPVDENDNEVIGVKLSEKWVEGTIEINEGKVVPIKINTTGTLFFIMPDFSSAIFSIVSPSIAVCSRLIVAIISRTGFLTALVASSLPPSPVSITQISTFCFRKTINAMPKK